MDYVEIYTKMRQALNKVREKYLSGGVEATVLLDSGTPQMQTAWFLLVRSGIFPARLVQGVPPLRERFDLG